MVAIDYLLNGRCTRSYDPVMSTVIAMSPASNYWCSSENSELNAWNVNFGDGNVNNNNKYNTNYVRAVSALDEITKRGWIEAFDDCCSNKMTSSQCIYYRICLSDDLMRLAAEVETRTYIPTTSFCFVVTRPRLREVFAANFRDRIVQHWITLRLNPYFEERHQAQGNVSFNCRKGFGTIAACDRLAEYMSEVSENYTSEAWVGRFDIRSFFMSIDKRILWEKLEPFINEHYKGPDKDTLLYLTKIIVFHCPQKNCIKRGNLALWNDLPKHKSLFYADDMIGMPIGNITSQLFANFYLSFFDEFMINFIAKFNGRFLRFVDDFVVVAKRKEDVIAAHDAAEKFLWNELHLILHKDKVNLQQVSHGMKLVGQVVKPGRRYTANTTVGHAYDAVNRLEETCEAICKYGPTLGRIVRLNRLQCSINSFNGFLCHTSSYNIRKELYETKTYIWKMCYMSNHLTNLHIKKGYKLRTYLKNEFYGNSEVIKEAGVCYENEEQIPPKLLYRDFQCAPGPGNDGMAIQ